MYRGIPHHTIKNKPLNKVVAPNKTCKRRCSHKKGKKSHAVSRKKRIDWTQTGGAPVKLRPRVVSQIQVAPAPAPALSSTVPLPPSQVVPASAPEKKIDPGASTTDDTVHADEKTRVSTSLEEGPSAVADETQFLSDPPSIPPHTAMSPRLPITEDFTLTDALYPNLDDPSFNIKIAQKKEFYDTRYDGPITDVKTQAEKACNSTFEILPHQLFVKNFLSMQTPYNSLLMYWGLGSGKTCNAIGVAEEMRSYMKQTGMNKRILVLASPNVINNFRLQLFDESKLVMEGGMWNIQSCVGKSILDEVNPTHLNELNKERLIANVQAIIKTYYDFKGYIKFSNEISNALKPFPEGDPRRIRKIQSMFNNHLIVIDEVHNIRLTRDNEDLTTANYLYMIAKHAKNLRFVLLSATPMYNSYKEIIWLTNLMNVNDKRPEITADQIFDKDGQFRQSGVNNDAVLVGKELLQKKLTGYVSHVRGENPYTFPFRIYKTNLPPHEENTKYPPLYLTTIGSIQEKVYQLILNRIQDRFTSSAVTDASATLVGSAESATLLGYAKGVAEKIREGLETLDNVGYEHLRYPIQALNIVYGNVPTDATADTINLDNLIGHQGLMNVMEISKDNRYSYRAGQPHIFQRKNLPKYSQKMAAILDLIEDSSGIVMIYSEFIDSGVIPMALALEEAGFTRASGRHNRTAPLFAEKPKAADKPKAAPKKPLKYAMITGNKTLSPNNREELEWVTNPQNVHGDRVKVVIISRAGAEGLDFKNIRQIHILEPWYNMSRIEQIIGRGVRNLSHCALPFEERNVEIYMHASQTTDKLPTADMYLYELAFKKAKQIGRVTRLLKEIAVDCLLNREQNNFTLEKMASVPSNRKIPIHTAHGDMEYDVGDRPHTAICDYSETCPTGCQPDVPEEEIKGRNVLTYSVDYVSMNRVRIVDRIRQLFIVQPYYAIEDLVRKIQEQRDYPIEQIYYALTYLIENRNEFLVDSHGRLGNLVNRGEIYAFQPMEITDQTVSVFDRTFPLEIKPAKVQVEVNTTFQDEPAAEHDDVDIAAPDTLPLPAPVKKSQVDHGSITSKVHYKTLLEGIQQNMDAMMQMYLLSQLKTTAPKSKKKKRPVAEAMDIVAREDQPPLIKKHQEWTDYMIVGNIMGKIEGLFGIDEVQIQKYMVYHHLDSLLLTSKLVFAQHWLDHAIPKAPKDTSLIEEAVHKYVGDRVHVAGAEKYLILTNTANELVIYKATRNDQGAMTWTAAEYTDIADARLRVLDPIQQSWTPLTDHISSVVGFFMVEQVKDSVPSAVLKIKDFTKTTTSRNAKGENLKKAGKQRTMAVFNLVLGNLGYAQDPETSAQYNEFNHGSICMMLELILRHSRSANVTNRGRASYMTAEEAALMKIS